MSKFTPGPWRYYEPVKHDDRWAIAQAEGAAYTSESSDVADVNPYSKSKQTTQANAQLISAAPEMYECLKGVSGNRRHLNDPHFSFVSDKLFALIDEALAKAEGES